MVFACQKDSFLKEFVTNVVSCEPGEINISLNGKEERKGGYEIVLEDTILFPEGGGQPCDFGTMNDIEVIQVNRRGAQAVHFLPTSIDVGTSVKQVLNWDRRLDHMQHHSGQHLITAVAYSLFGFETTSWWLGDNMCHIELDTKKITQEQIDTIEKISNEKIRDGLNVSVEVYPKNDPFLNEVRSRGLPEDHIGAVRVVTIDSVESDICCGTHVTNTSQLQVIKLFKAEKGKKGKVNLQFLVGERVLRHMGMMFKREQDVTALLHNGPESHVELVSKLQKTSKALSKNISLLLRELAVYDAKTLKAQDPEPKYYIFHRRDGDVDYINTFIREFGPTNKLLLLTVGDDVGAGHMVLYGKEELVKKIGEKLCELLDGKGAFKDSRFQSKVKNLKKRSLAENVINDTLAKALSEC